jgi:hypothetical protein
MAEHYCACCHYWRPLRGAYCAWCLDFFYRNRRLPRSGDK